MREARGWWKIVVPWGLVLVLLLGVGCTGGSEAREPAKKQTLVVSGWGGTWEKAMREAVIEPFQQKFNVEVTLALPGNSTQILARLRTEKGNPSMDVVAIGGGLEQVAANEGLMEQLNWANIPNAADLYPSARGPEGYGPSIASSAIGIAYNKEKVKEPPTSWLDFWNPEYKGHIGINNMDGNYGLAMFALVNSLMGGTKDNVEPGFAKFKELMSNKPIIVKSTDDAVTAMTQRDAWLVVMANSRAIQLAREGFPVGLAYPKEGAFVWGNYVGIPKGSKNKELGEKFINFWLAPEVQAKWATLVNYGPTNRKTVLPSDYGYANMLAPATVYDLDWDWINSHRSEWIDRWNKEVLPLLK